MHIRSCRPAFHAQCWHLPLSRGTLPFFLQCTLCLQDIYTVSTVAQLVWLTFCHSLGGAALLSKRYRCTCPRIVLCTSDNNVCSIPLVSPSLAPCSRHCYIVEHSSCLLDCRYFLVGYRSQQCSSDSCLICPAFFPSHQCDAHLPLQRRSRRVYHQAAVARCDTFSERYWHRSARATQSPVHFAKGAELKTGS